MVQKYESMSLPVNQWNKHCPLAYESTIWRPVLSDRQYDALTARFCPYLFLLHLNITAGQVRFIEMISSEDDDESSDQFDEIRQIKRAMVIKTCNY